MFIQGASADIRPFDWYDGNTNVSHSERTWSDAQAFAILLATQTIRAASNVITRRNAAVNTAISDEGNVSVLRIGDMTLVSTGQPHSTEFAVNLRAAFPETELMIGTNLAHGMISVDQRSAELAKAVEWIKRSGNISLNLGRSQVV